MAAVRVAAHVAAVAAMQVATQAAAAARAGAHAAAAAVAQAAHQATAVAYLAASRVRADRVVVMEKVRVAWGSAATSAAVEGSEAAARVVVGLPEKARGAAARMTAAAARPGGLWRTR